MGTRNVGILVAVFLAAGPAAAGNPYPAVDLPAFTPDSVRDATARSLAARRDALGWAVHPFRGEFHGLGAPEGTTSRAYDLSANGRVVVGANFTEDNSDSAFVWTPWTGNATYDMLPAGQAGDTVATTISADGVFVAGNAMLDDTTSTFRWSLATRELLPQDENQDRFAAALSGDGRALVGRITTTPYYEISPGVPYPEPPANWLEDVIITDFPAYTFPQNSAYQAEQRVGIESIGPLESYLQTEAVGISADRSVVLGNSQPTLARTVRNQTTQVQQPYLVRDGQTTELGGLFASQLDTSIGTSAVFTKANALSADGRTAVGVETVRGYGFSIVGGVSTIFPPSTVRSAVRWTEADGWIDLGEMKRSAGDEYHGSGAASVSGDGSRVVGSAQFDPVCECSVPDYHVAFLWDGQRGMRDLTEVLKFDYGVDLAGWTLEEATAISDDGTTIIGNGTNPDGVGEAWRAVLHRNTPHGDLDFDGDVDHHDFQALTGNLGLDSDSSAVFYADGDLNADGRVDESDKLALLGLYQHRWTGDFNADGLVDLADYTLWRDLSGEITDGIADANGDGLVNHQDLAAWRANLGRVVEAIVGLSVPEPGAACLIATLCVPAAAGRRQS